MLRVMLGEAWHAMGSNRLRTALTMLGMVIGVGSVVLMMAIGQGAQYAVAQTISTMGSNLYVVLAGWTQSAGVRTGGGYGFTLRIGDADAIAELDLGVHALAAIPQKSNRKGIGEVDLTLYFGGVSVSSGDFIYADNNGIVVAKEKLVDL